MTILYFKQLEVTETERSQVQLVPWGLQLNMSRTLNKYIVTNCSTTVSSNNFNLVISMDRMSGPFWFSLFIPSICLILAAEVTLFIGESHFEAMIMVALTSNLVMYTLYSSVQAALPEDSSLKLIDIWLLHGLLMPMVVFVVLAINELMISKPTPKTRTTKIAHSAITVSKQKAANDDLFENKMKTCMHACKAIIPTISIIFIIVFFIICGTK